MALYVMKENNMLVATSSVAWKTPEWDFYLYNAWDHVIFYSLITLQELHETKTRSM